MNAATRLAALLDQAGLRHVVHTPAGGAPTATFQLGLPGEAPVAISARLTDPVLQLTAHGLCHAPAALPDTRQLLAINAINARWPLGRLYLGADRHSCEAAVSLLVGAEPLASEWLYLALDGLGDVSNVVWVATTNHIDRISKRLQRAGRFDEVLPVTPPPPGDLLAWVAGLPVSDADKAWVTERAEGKTPSEVRELVIRRCILGGIEEPAVPEPTATEKPVSHPVSRKLDGANVVIHNIKLEI